MRNLKIIAGMALLAACQQTPVLIVDNSLPIDVEETPIVISRSAIEAKLQLTEGEFPVVMKGAELFPQQLDDLDGDGEWDEIALIAPTQANTPVQLELNKTEEYPVFDQRTSVYLGIDYQRSDNFIEKDSEVRSPENIAMKYPMMYQMEGPAWENDKVGFRLYFDSRNGKDIFGKTTAEMVLSRAGTKKQNYHELDDWGMDVLKVGNSLGAGAIAMLHADTLVPLRNTASGEYETLIEGPVRTIFEVRQKGWDTPLGSIDVTERISIWAGQYGYQEELITDIDGIKWVSGIVNKHSKEMIEGQTDGTKYIYTYDEQSENKDYMGMGLVVNKDSFLLSTQAPDSAAAVTETFYTVTNEGKFYFVAGWELTDPMFETQEGFSKVMEQQAQIFGNPIEVK
ncbi:DUF4861 domain-containing protein [Reichenbachiella ulvae]|uniref:DUF4861 domain-containing protein n=1 Tax=Reichenbachiella ulvae TaxID=2980104 RepID=A0ABT3CZZ2_9BACT|nr:DUF4861 domain-containing protein [Reichenbachiella ulvae]MCV9389070.1 DUF4861 domain-containing protein [Reichenbachiella ulvae]